jgi:hypothetical protein
MMNRADEQAERSGPGIRPAPSLTAAFIGYVRGKAGRCATRPGEWCKGKDAALDVIKAAGLDLKNPFTWINANAIERRINYHIGKLYATGKIATAYSCYDFRHFFAVNEYRKDKAILRISKLLNHAGIQITQKYLRSLGVSL